MNSIRRPRRRPRLRTYSFHTFGWLLLREAALRICYPCSIGSPSEPAARRACCSPDTAAVRGIAETLLRYRPDRTDYPPRPAEPWPALALPRAVDSARPGLA